MPASAPDRGKKSIVPAVAALEPAGVGGDLEPVRVGFFVVLNVLRRRPTLEPVPTTAVSRGAVRCCHGWQCVVL